MKRVFVIIIVLILFLLGCRNQSVISSPNTESIFVLDDNFNTPIQSIPSVHYEVPGDYDFQFSYLFLGLNANISDVLRSFDSAFGYLGTIDKLMNICSGIEHIETIDATHRMVALKVDYYEMPYYFYVIYEYKTLEDTEASDWYGTGNVFIYTDSVRKEDYGHIKTGDTIRELFSIIGIPNHSFTYSGVGLNNKKVNILLSNGVLSFTFEFIGIPIEEAGEVQYIAFDDYYAYDLVVEDILFVSYEDGGVFKYSDGTGKAPHLPITESQ